MGLRDEVTVDLSSRGGKLIVTPATELRFSLSELLARVTEENLHRAVEVDEAVRSEVW